jgi:hypothetical protein
MLTVVCCAAVVVFIGTVVRQHNKLSAQESNLLTKGCMNMISSRLTTLGVL